MFGNIDGVIAELSKLHLAVKDLSANIRLLITEVRDVRTELGAVTEEVKNCEESIRSRFQKL